jgi:hypothetical protein
VVCEDGVDLMLQFRLEERRRNKTLPKNEAEPVSSYWLNGKEA